MTYHNLLPDQYASDVRHEKLIRFFNLLFASAAAIILILLTLLLPSYFSLIYESDGIDGQISAARQGVGSKRVQEAENAIKTLNTELAQVAHYPSTPLTAYLKTIAEDTPAGITVTALSYSKSRGTFNLDGHANRRDDLLVFVSRLQNETMFSSVDSPITNLLKETDATFHLSLTLAGARANAHPKPAQQPPKNP